MKTIVLIDGHALAYRAFFVPLPFKAKTMTGENTNAVYIFTSMLLSVWKEWAPDQIIVTFDRGPTFRHGLYSDYKATREKMPSDLRSQMLRIEQVVSAFNFPVFSTDGYEADDLLGTLARQAAEQDFNVLIVTGDRDTFQLITPNIKVVISGRKFSDGELYDEVRVRERYGLRPAQLIELKGLVSDSSDNIPGVKGIGETTGLKLIQKYGTLEVMYEQLASLPAAQRDKLAPGREMAFLSRRLSTIITDVPGVELPDDPIKFDMAEVADLFSELEFSTLFTRVPGVPPDTSLKDVARIAGPRKPDGLYKTVSTTQELTLLIQKLTGVRQLAVDTETDSTDEMRTNLVGISISPASGEAYYIPLGHINPDTPPVLTTSQPSLFDFLVEEPPPTGPQQLSLVQVQASLGPILADPLVTKYFHNAKFDLVVLERHGLPVAPPIFDTMIAAWLHNNSPGARFGLKEMVREKLNIEMTEIRELIGSGKNQITMVQVPIESCTPYACADVDMTLRLATLLEPSLRKVGDLWEVFQELELPLVFVLKEMEMAGIKVDVDFLSQLSAELGQELVQIEQQIYEKAGRQLNINSTQQLSDLLFRDLKLPTAGLRITKSGHYSTAAEVLESLIGQHPVISLILEHRAVAKLRSTYVDALPALVNPKTGRIHTTFNQIGISTGRLSSSEPNLQNIPIRTERGREIRRAFVAEPGHKLIAADYSQLELRILADVADDPGLLAAFAQDLDVHQVTAAAVLGIPLVEVTKDQRRVAKSVNYGIAYGQTAFGLARSLGISQDEAQVFIDTYFEKYPGIKKYIDQTKQMAVAKGFVLTRRGRRRNFPNLASLIPAQRAAAEREAINTPIQGLAADIMKAAMIRLHPALTKNGLRSRILLQVHDELVLEAPDEEVPRTVELVAWAMNGAFSLKAPLKTDIEIGDCWLDMTEITSEEYVCELPAPKGG